MMTGGAGCRDEPTDTGLREALSRRPGSRAELDGTQADIVSARRSAVIKLKFSDMLDPRAQTLLKTLIERYIAEGQPVGSRTLSRYSGLELSPATIRNVMSDLEDLGLVISPHTSAGRIPTPRGYRLFVDTMLTVESAADEEAVMRTVKPTLQAGEPQKIVAAAASVLSNLSQFAGVVLTPRRSHVFKQIEFMRLSDKRILLIIVTPEGDVQNRIMATQRDYSPSQLTEASNYINANFAGLFFGEGRRRLGEEIDLLGGGIASLIQEAVAASVDETDQGDTLLISGERNLLEVADLSSD